MNPGQQLLIVGNSVRYLAQSASRCGYAATGVDLFADTDTRAACRRVISAARQDAAGLADVCLAADLPTDTGWIYGAGFEADPERLQILASLGPCLGNSPQTLMLLSRPDSFFALLEDLGISYPPVSLLRPDDPRGWLLKRAGSFGGLGVQPARLACADNRTHYYQRQVPGSVCSLTFLANGSDVEVLGINRLHAVDDSQGDFRFSSVCSRFNPGAAPARQMIDMARKLTASQALRGANSIDCVLNDDQLLLLELNARPPATLELYERALPDGGVAAHIAACNGELTRPVAEAAIRGYRICYAAQELLIGQVEWPEWSSDRPPVGTRCQSGSPVCGLHATAASELEVDGLLQQREEQINLLIGLSNQEAA